MHAAGIESLLCFCCKSFSINTLNCRQCGTAAHVVFVCNKRIVCVCVICVCLAPMPCSSNSFNTVSSLLSCDGIPALWHNSGYTRTRTPMHVFMCVCPLNTMLTAEPRGQHHPEKCVDMPPLNKEAVFYSAWEKMGFYKPEIIWGTQRSN